MLSLLLDENISHEIAMQVMAKRPEIPIVSVHEWREGRLRAQPDDLILTEAAREGLTLVTYDQKTIIPLLVEWGHVGIDHAGVIFIDHLTVAPNEFGALVRALIALWTADGAKVWTNAITFLRAERSSGAP